MCFVNSVRININAFTDIINQVNKCYSLHYCVFLSATDKTVCRDYHIFIVVPGNKCGDQLTGELVEVG